MPLCPMTEHGPGPLSRVHSGGFNSSDSGAVVNSPDGTIPWKYICFSYSRYCICLQIRFNLFFHSFFIPHLPLISCLIRQKPIPSFPRSICTIDRFPRNMASEHRLPNGKTFSKLSSLPCLLNEWNLVQVYNKLLNPSRGYPRTRRSHEQGSYSLQSSRPLAWDLRWYKNDTE